MIRVKGKKLYVLECVCGNLIPTGFHTFNKVVICERCKSELFHEGDE